MGMQAPGLAYLFYAPRHHRRYFDAEDYSVFTLSSFIIRFFRLNLGGEYMPDAIASAQRNFTIRPTPTIMEKKLFLLDAYALIFRAYYALISMPRINSKGMNTSAVFGFVNSLEELLRKENPTHIAVCFDPPGPTFRHEAYPEYKGERDATPEDIKLSVPYIKRIIKAYNIPILEVAGFEADDVIGTIATKAAAVGFQAYMMTPDKDFGQLVTDNILQYKPAHRGLDAEVCGPKEICARYGIEHASQVLDLLALMGDKVDNIPGCPGVGEKTAVKLIAEFGSVDKLVNSTESLKGALKKKVEENKEQILFSKFLAAIRTDVPLQTNPDDLKSNKPDTKQLFEIFDELEFRQLKDRVQKRLNAAEVPQSKPTMIQGSLFDFLDEPEPIAEPEPEKPQQSIADTKPEYVALTDETAWLALQQAASGKTELGLAVLAPGPSDMNAPCLGLAIATSTAKAFYIHRPEADAVQRIAAIFENSGAKPVSGDIKRCYVALYNVLRANADILNKLFADYFDDSLAHYLLQPDIRHDLTQLSEQYLGYRMMTLDELMPGTRGDLLKRYESLSPDAALSMTCEMADIALRLHTPLEKAVAEQGMQELLTDIELPLAMVLARMETIGVPVDVNALNKAAEELENRIAELQQEIWADAGIEFNIGSPARVGEVLFDHLKLDAKAKKTKSGQYSTSEEILEKIAHLHPVVGKILKYRQLRKLVNTYLNALPETINPLTGRIHTTYNQTVTATGRISSSEPNLQNIPVRQGDGHIIRKAFTASPGNLFLAVDYSQIELRLAADFANDPVMLEAFREGIDIHSATAAKIYHKPLDEVTADERRKAKTANFGILYGISAFGLASRLNIPRSEAKELIDNYFATFPTIRDYMSDSIERAQKDGYVTTIHNRRRMLPDINSKNPVVRGYAERNAINAPIQGSAADIIKIAMVNIDREMRSRNFKSKMIMQVHDELDFDVVPDELPQLQEMVQRLMQQAYSGRVALTAEAGVGPDWLAAH